MLKLKPKAPSPSDNEKMSGCQTENRYIPHRSNQHIQKKFHFNYGFQVYSTTLIKDQYNKVSVQHDPTMIVLGKKERMPNHMLVYYDDPNFLLSMFFLASLILELV